MPPLPGQIYRHYKGNNYTILALAKHSETLEDMVVYQSVANKEDVWVRPLAMFQEQVEINGQKIQRFTRLKGKTP